MFDIGALAELFEAGGKMGEPEFAGVGFDPGTDQLTQDRPFGWRPSPAAMW